MNGNSEQAFRMTQFHFTAWPDHGVPENVTSILAFHRTIKKQFKIHRGPLLVHCRSVSTLNKLNIMTDHITTVLMSVRLQYSSPLTVYWIRFRRRGWWILQESSNNSTNRK